MASQKSIAILVDKSQQRLRDSVPKLVSRFDVQPPSLNIPKRYALDYRRAMELNEISLFIESISNQETSGGAQQELDAIKAMVAKPVDKWTKQQLVDLVLGVEDEH